MSRDVRYKPLISLSKLGGCPSSIDLRQLGGFRKGGSGSSLVEIMRHAVDAANDDWRWTAFDLFAFEEDGLGPSEVDVSRSEIVEALAIILTTGSELRRALAGC